MAWCGLVWGGVGWGGEDKLPWNPSPGGFRRVTTSARIAVRDVSSGVDAGASRGGDETRKGEAKIQD